jgi:hypothetical protein
MWAGDIRAVKELTCVPEEPSAFDPFFLTAVSSFLWFGKGPQATTRKGQQLSS